MRIHAISDIHIEYETNAEAIAQLSEYDYRGDILILAGDVSHNPLHLEQCFAALAYRFKQVFYVPGNHDIWIGESDYPTSFDKYHFIRSLAEACNISMEACHIGTLSIVPLLGWYDYSFGKPNAALQHMWMDYFECNWPDGYDQAAITQYFLARNTIDIPLNNTVISFSHFLPRIDLMPNFIPKRHRILYPVLGSTLIDRQIRQLQSKVHVYGHTHFNRNVEIDGVLYINNAFGYPDETLIAAKQLRCIYEHE